MTNTERERMEQWFRYPPWSTKPEPEREGRTSMTNTELADLLDELAATRENHRMPRDPDRTCTSCYGENDHIDTCPVPRALAAAKGLREFDNCLVGWLKWKRENGGLEPIDRLIENAPMAETTIGVGGFSDGRLARYLARAAGYPRQVGPAMESHLMMTAAIRLADVAAEKEPQPAPKFGVDPAIVRHLERTEQQPPSPAPPGEAR